MAAVQLADGVWRLPTKPFDLVNSFLFAGPDGSLTLLDAGYKSASKPIVAALAGLGKQLGDLTHLLLTHAHYDHAGAAAKIVTGSGADVWSHDREAVYLREGRMPATDPSTRGGRLLARTKTGGFAKLEVAHTFADGDVLPIGGGITAVHTPGHTPGHCSYLHTSTGVLVTGDALFNVRGLRWPFQASCTDLATLRSSAQRLGELDYEIAGFTHGAHVSTGARSAVRAFLDRQPA